MNKKIKKINLVNELEVLLNTNSNLLEIAKTYCEFNHDKATEINALSSIIEVTLKNQKKILNNIDILTDY